MYQVKRPARSEFVPIRNLSYHVLVWGTPPEAKTPLVLLHGWMDVAASYQFVIDALRHEHYIIAPDWRGYGKTRAGEADNFWFPDYLVDLDFLLDHYAPQRPINLVGHSMDGNVAMHYGGIRPERIRRLINLEGFGMAASTPDQAPQRYGRWMDCIDPAVSAQVLFLKETLMSKKMEDDIKRWTAKRKAALVMEIMQGKSTVAEASRSFDLAPSEIEVWVDDAKRGMENALRAKPLEVKEQYERQIKDLQEAYGEAMLELRARKKLNSMLGMEGDK
jgi:pimeloyl-ACP methyl ester carboxylesterase